MQELARKFLRSLIQVAPNEDLKDNIFKIGDVDVDFSVSETGAVYQRVFQFVKDFYPEYNHYPSMGAIETAFQERMDLEVLDETKEIRKLPLETGSGFQYLVDENLKEINRISFNILLKETQAINNGEVLKDKKNKLKGSLDAVNYLINKSERYFNKGVQDASTIDVSKNTADAWKRYETAKNGSPYGILSGLHPIDEVLKGVKKKDLLLVAGSTGECKTTLSLNWAYNASVNLGYNVLFITMEMSKENVQDMYNAIHAANSKIWGNSMDKQGRPLFPSGLDYDHIRDGQLGDDVELNGMERFYKIVLDDLRSKGQTSRQRGYWDNRGYGSFEVWEPPTELTPTLLRSTAEYKHQQLGGGVPGRGLHLLVVDHPGLMATGDSRQSETAMVNEIMKKMKILARTFGNGEGIPVICPFQINREGKKNAVAKTENDPGMLEKPIYSSFHLAQSNEAERSADYVIYTYLNQDLRDSNQLHVGCIKNRHGKIFHPFLASAYLPSRRIFMPPAEYTTQAPGEVVEVSV